MSDRFQGKVALVTGGSRGWASPSLTRWRTRATDVAITYVASAEKAEAVAHALASKGSRAAAFRSDQGDPTQAAPLIRAVVELRTT